MKVWLFAPLSLFVLIALTLTGAVGVQTPCLSGEDGPAHDMVFTRNSHPDLINFDPIITLRSTRDVPVATNYAYFEDFEAGDGGFTTCCSWHSTWQWGAPASGPGNAHSGTKVWATNLSGKHLGNEDSYIDSPNIDLAAYAGQIPVLSWWQWLRTGDYNGALASVLVSNNGGATWARVYGEVGGNVDTVWTKHVVVLDPSYVVSNFRARFRLRYSSPWVPGGPGYYVDDVAIETFSDLPDAHNVEQVGFYTTPGDARSVYVAGNYAFVADGGTGDVRVVDVSDPSAPVEVSSYGTTANAGDVFVADTYAYVADGKDLRVVDVSDPVTPLEVGTYSAPTKINGVYVTDGYAYVADGDAGLRVVDVSDSAVPQEVGAYTLPGRHNVRDVFVAGDYAYVAINNVLLVMDVSDPTAPARVGSYDVGGPIYHVYIAGGYAYMAAGGNGLRVVDVSDPTVPVELGTFDRPGSARDVHTSGGYAYTIDDEGLWIVDASDPAMQEEVGFLRFFSMPPLAGSIFVAGGYAYVADGNGGLFILRYTAQASPAPTVMTTSTPTATRINTSTPTPTPTVTPPSTSSPMPTEPPTPTPKPTVTRTSVPTSIPTPTATWTSTPTPRLTPPAGDPYEPDDTCTSAVPILPNGDPQEHTFHTPGDPDWLRFQTTAGADYIVSALQAGPNAHPIIHLYDACDKDPFADSSSTFGFDQIITFRAERSGLYFLKLTHRDESAYGDDTAYQVSVRPATTGAAIIAGGRLYQREEFQQQITFMTNRAYNVFRQAGYDHDNIFYMSADPNRPPYMDAPSLPGNLQYAIDTWAPSHIEDGAPLFLYLTDHGENEFFFLDTGAHKVTPDDLDQWLLSFEAQRPHSPVVVIIESCRSGSFITPLGTISHPGRVVVTAAGDDSDAYAKPPGQGGAFFSDAFFGALAQNYDLWQSYQIGRQAVREKWGQIQTPWIDGNGNGLPYPIDSADEGAGRSLGLGRVAGLAGGQAPYIERATVPRPDGDTPVLIQVKVLDENPEGMTVWMEVTRPSTPPPSAPPGYITPISHAERVDLTYNPISGRFEAEFAFDEVGAYQLVFNAEDAGGQRAQAVSVRVARAAVYLPLVTKQ